MCPSANHEGIADTAEFCVNLGVGWNWEVSSTFRLLYSGETIPMYKAVQVSGQHRLRYHDPKVLTYTCSYILRTTLHDLTCLTAHVLWVSLLILIWAKYACRYFCRQTKPFACRVYIFKKVAFCVIKNNLCPLLMQLLSVCVCYKSAKTLQKIWIWIRKNRG